MKKITCTILTTILAFLLVSCETKKVIVTFIDECDIYEIKNIEIESGKCIDEPKSIESNGYEFIGWFIDPFFEEKFDFNKPILDDTILYAKWHVDVSINKMNSFIDSLLDSTQEFVPSWNKESFKGRWNYIDGVFLNSIVNLYKQTKDSKYKDFFIKYINYYISPNGVFLNLINPSNPGYKSGELDTVCASKVLFDAYEITKDSRYLSAIEFTYNELINMPRCENGVNFWHKLSYQNQIWLDGMYMYAPFYARYAKMKNFSEIFNEIKLQYQYIRDNMFDEQAKLYYHGHDTGENKVFWANTSTGNSSSFWLRSIGWYLVSLVDVLEYFPEGANKDYLKELLIEGIDGILQYQDEKTNMFYQVVDLMDMTVNVSSKYLSGLKNEKYLVDGEYVNSEIKNYLESSGSSMIAYCLMKGSSIGVLSKEKYDNGVSVLRGIFNEYFDKNELSNICITAGLGPSNNQIRDGSISYYLAEPVGTNDAKGVGPFIMAYLEYLKNN